jgi:putative ABC transport system permease protein
MKQLEYMKKKNPGFRKEEVVILPVENQSVWKSLDLVKEELKNIPGVMVVSAASTIPGWIPPKNQKLPEGYTFKEMQLMDDINVEYDFIPALGIELEAGRNFSPEFPGDSDQSVVINEAAVKKYGWDNPVGKIIRAWGLKGLIAKRVIGVIKDVHFRPLSQAVVPVYISSDRNHPYNPFRVIIIRVSAGNIAETVGLLKRKWEYLFPDLPFDYSFLDETFNRQFGEIERFRELFSYFTVMAILIACLGLFGLTSFMAEQKTKEIGIRKTFGASVSSIILMMAAEFLKWVLLATLIGWPVAYLAVQRWLQGFADPVRIGPWPFIISAFLAFLIAALTVSFQSVKAGLTNPVEALRYE